MEWMLIEGDADVAARIASALSPGADGLLRIAEAHVASGRTPGRRPAY
jgi:hypothetical protein